MQIEIDILIGIYDNYDNYNIKLKPMQNWDDFYDKN